MPEMDLERITLQLQECIEGGYGNARTPIDWFRVGLPLLKVAIAAKKYRACKTEQSDRATRSPHIGMICKHVVYNGGSQDLSCVAELFVALDELGALSG